MDMDMSSSGEEDTSSSHGFWRGQENLQVPSSQVFFGQGHSTEAGMDMDMFSSGEEGKSTSHDWRGQENLQVPSSQVFFGQGHSTGAGMDMDMSSSGGEGRRICRCRPRRSSSARDTRRGPAWTWPWTYP